MRNEEPMTQLVHAVATAARLLDTTSIRVRELISNGQLKSVRIGGVLKVPHSELLRLIETGDGSTTRRGKHMVAAAEASSNVEEA